MANVAGPAVLFSESPTVLQGPPPTLGQHTVEILQQQLDYDDNRINELTQSKIIQQNWHHILFRLLLSTLRDNYTTREVLRDC